MATGYRMANPAVTPAASAQVIEPKDSLNDSSRSLQSHSSTLYVPMFIQHTYTTSIYMSRRLAPHVTLFLLLKRVCPHSHNISTSSGREIGSPYLTGGLVCLVDYRTVAGAGCPGTWATGAGRISSGCPGT